MLGYRTDRFTLLAAGTFWLSQTPDRPGKGWDAAYPRIASWARLRDRTASQTLLVVNTHFDHVGQVARVESAKLIRRWIGDHRQPGEDRQSGVEGKSASVGVDLGGRRSIKKK